MRALIVLMLASCTQVIEATTEPEDLAAAAEAYCAAHPELPCGHVYLCGEAEVCVADFLPIGPVEATHGPCMPTPRHQGLCWWCVGEGCGAGCNALNGCWAP